MSLAKTPSLNRPWAELAPRERDAWLAEVLMDYPKAAGRSGTMTMWKGEPCWPGNPPLNFPATCPRYSSDMEAAFKMEEAVRARGLEKEYVRALRDVLFYGHGITHEQHFAFVHATAEQRAHAAFRMLAKGDIQ